MLYSTLSLKIVFFPICSPCHIQPTACLKATFSVNQNIYLVLFTVCGSKYTFLTNGDVIRINQTNMLDIE